MITQAIELKKPERFSTIPEVSKAKLTKAVEAATDKLEANLPRFTDNFTPPCTIDFVYPPKENCDWINGMHTGLYWLSYQLTGNKKFLAAAEKHLSTYAERFEKKAGLNNHDNGFVFTPSCVAAYKITGDEKARKLALADAEWFYENHFSKDGGFIIRYGGHNADMPGYRTMMDTMMNIPLLMWAGEETGKTEYIEAAKAQYRTTMKYLIRDDASTYHHYQFDLETHKGVKGVTLQGFSDESCWGRGHAWGIYGLPIAYSYTKDSEILPVHRDITYYLLNVLPDDCIPYWDLIFTQGSDEPRDSSVAAISVCGLREMNKFLPDDAPQKKIFASAEAQMMNALIDKCANFNNPEADGILMHVTHALPQKAGIDECAIYGDYFYLEALARYIMPDKFIRFW